MDPLKDLLKDFAKGAGTYLKVVRFSELTNPDGVIVLYLRPSDRFLLLGYWRGYEHSQAVGHWTKDSGSLHLKGHGRLSTDSLAPTPAGGRFERVFSVDDVVHALSFCIRRDERMGSSRLERHLHIRGRTHDNQSGWRVAPRITV